MLNLLTNTRDIIQRKFPVLSQEDLFSTIEKFRAIDLDDKGWVEKQQALEAISQSGDATYDVARETLKQVNVDASGRVELDDYVELIAKLKESQAGPAPQTTFDTGSPAVMQLSLVALQLVLPTLLTKKRDGSLPNI